MTFVCFVCVDVCVSVCRCTGAIICQWRSEDQRESVLSSHCGAPRGQTWGIRLGSRRIICRAILPALRNVLTVHRIYLLLGLDRTSPDCLFSSCLCSHCLLLLPCSVWQAFWFLQYQFKSHLLRDVSSNTLCQWVSAIPL